MDALVPDYIYPSLLLTNNVNFAKVFARTAGPEVTISIEDVDPILSQYFSRMRQRDRCILSLEAYPLNG